MKHSEEERKEFLDNVHSKLNDIVRNESLDAWFFNWADEEEDEKKEAEKTINDILPGNWRFVHLWGNFTDVGEGWFAEDEYEIYISLACFGTEECIDSFDVYYKEDVDYSSIENKPC